MNAKMMFIALAHGAAAMSVVLAATVLTIAGANTPVPSTTEAQADAAIADRVYAALNNDPFFFFHHVEVSVNHGVVHLGGMVWTGDALYRAKQIATGVPGVTRVVNKLELERSPRTGGGG